MSLDFGEPGLVLRQHAGGAVEVIAAHAWVMIADAVLLAPDRDPAVLDVQAEGDRIVVCGRYAYRHAGPVATARAQLFHAESDEGDGYCVPLDET